MVERLSNATIARLPVAVQRPAYDRSRQKVGLVHIGLGAFHRGHQAVYTDDAMAGGDQDWAIIGVSLNSARLPAALGPQDGLYTLAERSHSHDRLRVIGAVQRTLFAPADPEAVVNALADAAVDTVTLTVTEKGYLRASGGGLIADAPELASDLAGEAAPRTIYGFIAAALARRQVAGRGGLTLVSCDNVADNGRKLATLLDEFLSHRDASLAQWARTNVACPNTVVDRIVPAPASSDIDRISRQLGVADHGAISTEPFRMWMIEDKFAGRRPRWEHGGALVVRGGSGNLHRGLSGISA